MGARDYFSNIFSRILRNATLTLADLITKSPWVDIRYYGAVGDDVTDDSKALMEALNAGNVLLPIPSVAWRIDNEIIVPPGRYITGVLGARPKINSYVGSGRWAFTFEGLTQRTGGGMKNFELHIKTSGANGIKAYECRAGDWSNFSIDGSTIVGGVKSANASIGFLLDGGDIGSAWCSMEHFHICHCLDAGLRIDTTIHENAWSNRHKIGLGHLYGCDIGLDIVKGATNFLTVGPQECNTGIRIRSGSKWNYIFVSEEKCTSDSILIEEGANNNMIYGALDKSKITNNGINNGMILHNEIRLNNINSNIRFENSGSNRWISTEPGSTDNIIIAVRDSGGALVPVASAISNVANPYLNLYEGARIQSKSYIYSGEGSPEGSQSAPPGSLYLNSNIAPGECALYIKRIDTGNRGWEEIGTPL